MHIKLPYKSGRTSRRFKMHLRFKMIQRVDRNEILFTLPLIGSVFILNIISSVTEYKSLAQDTYVLATLLSILVLALKVNQIWTYLFNVEVPEDLDTTASVYYLDTNYDKMYVVKNVSSLSEEETNLSSISYKTVGVWLLYIFFLLLLIVG